MEYDGNVTRQKVEMAIELLRTGKATGYDRPNIVPNGEVKSLKVNYGNYIMYMNRRENTTGWRI